MYCKNDIQEAINIEQEEKKKKPKKQRKSMMDYLCKDIPENYF